MPKSLSNRAPHAAAVPCPPDMATEPATRPSNGVCPVTSATAIPTTFWQHQDDGDAGEEHEEHLPAARHHPHVGAEADGRKEREHEIRLLRALERDLDARRMHQQDRERCDEAAGYRVRDRIAAEEVDARRDEAAHDQHEGGKRNRGGTGDRVRHRGWDDWEDRVSTA